MRCCTMDSRLRVSLAEVVASSERASIRLVNSCSFPSIKVNCVNIAGRVFTSVVTLDDVLLMRAPDFSTETCMSLEAV
jgi:hypothetical protein